MSTLDPVFGLHAQAMAVQRKRMEVLAENIANADTPNFRARDVDFAGQLSATLAAATRGAAGPSRSTLESTAGSPPDSAGTIVSGYVVPTQPSADGNTVDLQAEQAKFADAALHCQASLSFADSRLRSLLSAITGQ